MNDSLNKLTNTLNYHFKNTDLLELALTHRSVGSGNNERLEYLGDAILGFIIADSLYQKFETIPEGILTRQRASLVKKETLAGLAKNLKLGEFLNLGSGERKSGGWHRDSILANSLEAIIGAVYLDGGFEACREFVTHLYSELLESLSLEDTRKDPKTELQEFLQARKQALPTYQVIAEEGEAHKRVFTVACQLETLASPISASGKSKRMAEQSAAQKTLALLRSDK